MRFRIGTGRSAGSAAPVVRIVPGLGGFAIRMVRVVVARPRQLALEPLKVGLGGAVLKFSSNLGLLCLRPAAAHGGTPSRNNGAAQQVGGSDLLSLLSCRQFTVPRGCVLLRPAPCLACRRSVPRNRSTATRPAPG